MFPLAIVLAQNLSGAFFSLGNRSLAKRMPQAQMQVTAVIFMIMYAVTIPIVLASGNIHADALYTWWPLLSLSGAALGMQAVTMYVALRHLDAAMASLFAACNVLLTVIGAILVLDEHLRLQEVLGAAIVFAAILYALSAHVSKRQRRNWTLGIFFTMISGVFMAIGLLSEKYLLAHMSAQSYIMWGWTAELILAVLLSLLIGRHLYRKVLHRRNIALLLGASTAKASMALSFVVSLVVLRSLSIAIVLASVRPIFVAILDALVLKERQFLHRKIIASCISAVGIALLFWR